MTTEREAFEAFVKSELGDIAVSDDGRYISPKIQNYWITWQASRKALVAELESDCGGRCNEEYNPCNSRITADRIKEILK